MKNIERVIIDHEVRDEDRLLIDRAMAVLKANYNENVQYHVVGAAIRCTNGNIYTGVNCDGIHGSCAEFIAIGAAISNGEREFDTIVAVHQKAINGVVAPCGNCRQMLFEYCPDIKVLLNDEENNVIKVEVKALLPFAYVECV